MGRNIGMKIGFGGFVVALIGAVVGFSGYGIGERGLSLIGFVITVLGVCIGFCGIVYGWISEGRKAISGSIEAAKKLSKN